MTFGRGDEGGGVQMGEDRAETHTRPGRGTKGFGVLGSAQGEKTTVFR